MFARETQLDTADHIVTGEADDGHTAARDGGKPSLVLPPADTKRWSSRRKAAVLVAIRGGIITREAACELYMLSEEELAGWEIAFDKCGIPGLRITSRDSYRATTPRKVAAP